LPLDGRRLSIDERVQPGQQRYSNAQQQAQAYESQTHDQGSGMRLQAPATDFPSRATTKVLTFFVS
jgi:hypothetical protein